MNPVDKALWYIETHFAGEITLDFERYGPQFDPCTGSGEVEIWVPIRG